MLSGTDARWFLDKSNFSSLVKWVSVMLFGKLERKLELSLSCFKLAGNFGIAVAVDTEVDVASL